MPGISYGCDYTLYPGTFVARIAVIAHSMLIEPSSCNAKSVGDPSRVHAVAALLIDWRTDDCTTIACADRSSQGAMISGGSLHHEPFFAEQQELSLQNEWRYIQSAVSVVPLP